MHRLQLLALLDRYKTSSLLTAEEKPFLEKIIALVKSSPDCFKREHLPEHITASALVINAENDHMILMHHRKLGIWVQPGGHADGESDVLAVALKEALEETGIEKISPLSADIFDVDIHWIPAGKTNPPVEHWHYDIRFILQAAPGSKIIKNNESLDVQWMSAAQALEKTTDRAVIRLIEKWLQRA